MTEYRKQAISSRQFDAADDTTGHERVIRTSDRVHLTPDGARIYGQEIAHDLTAGLGVFTAPKPC